MERFRSLVRKIRGFFPSSLPLGAAAFDDFASSIIEIYNIPNDPSYRHAIATMIMHLGPTTTMSTKRYFAVSIRKAMANEVAYHKIQELKEEAKKTQEAKEEATKLVPNSEVSSVSSGGSIVGEKN